MFQERVQRLRATPRTIARGHANNPHSRWDWDTPAPLVIRQACNSDDGGEGCNLVIPMAEVE